jgi:uncharacterized DUF497 family protein
MRKLPIGWSSIDDGDNFRAYGINFKLAVDVIRNLSSVRVLNLYYDYMFIGPTSDLNQVLTVNCKLEDGFRKIISARNSTPEEMDEYFKHLATGEFK